jgi:putative DNA primase/helicase
MTAQPPRELRECPQWVSWHWAERDGKRTKIPINPKVTDRNDNPIKARSNDRHTWGTYDQAVAFTEKHGLDGVGFMFSVDDDYAGVDLDHCVNEAGELEPWAAEAVREIDSYSEISPSGTGVKMIVKATLPPKGRKRDNVEMYNVGRFFTITAQHLAGTPSTVEQRQEAIDNLHAKYLAPKEAPERPAPTPITLSLADDEVLERAFRATNGTMIRHLHEGGDKHASRSDDDMAYCDYLAFYADSPDQIVRIWRSSGRWRNKCDETGHYPGMTYAEGTAAKAFQECSGHYSGARAEQVRQSVPRVDIDLGDCDPPCGHVVAPLLTRIAELEAERDMWRERALRAEEHHSADAQARGNPHLDKGVSNGIVGAINYYFGEVTRGKADDDGWVEAPMDRVEESTGMKVDALRRAFDRADAWQIIPKRNTRKLLSPTELQYDKTGAHRGDDYRPEYWQPTYTTTKTGKQRQTGHVNIRTGECQPLYISTLKIKVLAQSHTDALHEVATLRPLTEGKDWGGKREKRSMCCDAPIIQVCSACGQEVDESESLKTQDAVSELSPPPCIPSVDVIPIEQHLAVSELHCHCGRPTSQESGLCLLCQADAIAVGGTR